ncbi:MAG: NCS2 family permease [Bacilli bacterium]|jgi:AGZA family xanthine/uracil permease-like MFS transporter|nr:NCS2 family permease [Bacilli bacterium]
MLDKFFKISARGSNVRTEIIAGITTFLSMAYILFVNPNVLEVAGMNKDAVFVVTGIAAAIGTLIMALYANYPVAQAPGMGMNAFFAYTVVSTMGYTFSQALFAVFCSGILFILISASGLREKIINAIPKSLKYAVSAGIGMFIAFIGLKGAGIVEANEATIVSLGHLGNSTTLLAIIGIIVTLVLLARNTKAAIFIGLVVTAVIGIVAGIIATPSAVVSMPPSIEPVFLKLFQGDLITLLTDYKFLMVIFTVLFLDFFDTAGTLMGVATRAGLLNDKGELIDADKALMADATATTVGAMLGTSSVTSYAESVVGVESGGKTGLMSLTVAVLFLLSMVFSPLLAVVTETVTAPALVSVGCLMMASALHIDFEDFIDTTAAFLTMIFMVLSYSIATGIAVGFLVYVILKLCKGDGKKIHPIMYGLAIMFILYFLTKA